MGKKFFLIVVFFVVSLSVFAERYTMKINSAQRSSETIDNSCLFCALYAGSKTKFMWPEYYVDIEKQTKIRYNNPFVVNPRDGAADQIAYFIANGKYYVGHYSIVSSNGGSFAMAAFEFDDYDKARQVLFLWSYLKLLQSRDCTELHFIPNDSAFWWNENDPEGFDLELPKDMIDDNYSLYKAYGFKNAFVDEQLLMNDEWHDLSKGKTYKVRKDVYSSKDGVLYCNGKKANLSNDINKMIHVSKYQNSEKFYQLLTKGAGYYYCERCANNPYGSGLRPIEFYGYHYQDITSSDFWKEKAGSWRKVVWELDDSIKCTK